VALELSDQAGPRHYESSWREGAYLHFAIFEAGYEEHTQRAQFGFSVDNLLTAHKRAIAAGARVVEEPRDEPWGPTAVYRDPDGNLVSLTQL
jgi:predicted enzyme related to lactoylglutathione lyase